MSEEYEKWLKNKDRIPNTTSHYLRKTFEFFGFKPGGAIDGIMLYSHPDGRSVWIQDVSKIFKMYVEHAATHSGIGEPFIQKLCELMGVSYIPPSDGTKLGT